MAFADITRTVTDGPGALICVKSFMHSILEYATHMKPCVVDTVKADEYR